MKLYCIFVKNWQYGHHGDYSKLFKVKTCGVVFVDVVTYRQLRTKVTNCPRVCLLPPFSIFCK